MSVERKRTGRPPTPEITEGMYVDYCTGMSVADVAAKWERSTHEVRRRFTKAELPLRKGGGIRVEMAEDDPRHGTENGYGNLCCRCAKCRQAHALRMQEDRRRRLAGPIPERVHGTINGYQNYRCRCERCKAVHNARNRKQYAEKYSAEATGSTWGKVCKHGHRLEGENLYIRRDNGRKQCKACAADRLARYRQQKAEASRAAS